MTEIASDFGNVHLWFINFSGMRDEQY